MATLPLTTSVLHHADWVHALARRMVRDPHLADDLAQDALEAGLKGPADKVQNPRAWLAGAMRNLHREELRKRKVRRERASALDLETPGHSAGELAERMEILQKVSMAVMDLPEDHSKLIILRFYEKQSVRSITAELGMGRRQVENRLTQALKLLRESPRGARPISACACARRRRRTGRAARRGRA